MVIISRLTDFFTNQTVFETLSRDLFYAFRALRKNPGFALTAFLTLAIGIGANTAMFTVIRAVLLKPLAYAEPDRVVRISGGATLMHFDLIRADARSYTAVGAFAVGMENMTLSGSQPEMLKGARVTSNF